MDDNPLGELCKGVVDISKCNILNRELAKQKLSTGFFKSLFHRVRSASLSSSDNR